MDIRIPFLNCVNGFVYSNNGGNKDDEEHGQRQHADWPGGASVEHDEKQHGDS
ncbi:hypothetical protein [Acidipila sp. EB88]|uniref:hypothetical protein n=1 Tax=Acidipila sp. EB88 TaxID=2305226 RepID=UPI001315867E|nr:hypothetical protein [Acidipila sp. EB88]